LTADTVVAFSGCCFHEDQLNTA